MNMKHDKTIAAGILLAIAVLSLWAGCTPGASAENTATPMVNSSLSTQMDVFVDLPRNVEIGQPVEITVTLSNRLDASLPYWYSGDHVEVVIKDSSDTVVWNSYAYPLEDFLTLHTLEAGATESFTFKWDQTNTGTAQLVPSEYEIISNVRASLTDEPAFQIITSDPKHLRIQ